MKNIYFICLMTIATILNFNCSIRVGVKNTSTTTTGNLKIGDYILFGKYEEKPILWRLINIDEEGNPMLFSERILTFKAFNGFLGGGAGVEYNSDLIQKHQSVYWGDSNIRQWLNSTDKSINWIGTPPSLEYLKRSPYDNESGFLSEKNFTKEEVSIILPYQHRVILSRKDADKKEGGINNLNEGTSYLKYLNNEDYENLYYKNFTDKIFLLSSIEVKEYLIKRGWECRRKPTEEAAEKNFHDTMNDLKDNPGINEQDIRKIINAETYDSYWLKTPQLYGSSVWTVSSEYTGMIFMKKGPSRLEELPQWSSGVCPAMVVKKDAYQLDGGNGSETKPYVLKPMIDEN